MDRSVGLRAGFGVAGDEESEGETREPGFRVGKFGGDLPHVRVFELGVPVWGSSIYIDVQEADGYVGLILRREIWAGVRDLEPYTLRWCLKLCGVESGENKGPGPALRTPSLVT